MKRLLLSLVPVLTLVASVQASECEVMEKTFMLNEAGVHRWYPISPNATGRVLSEQEVKSLLISYFADGLAVIVEPGTKVELLAENRSSTAVKMNNERYLILTPGTVKCQ